MGGATLFKKILFYTTCERGHCSDFNSEKALVLLCADFVLAQKGNLLYSDSISAPVASLFTEFISAPNMYIPFADLDSEE